MGGPVNPHPTRVTPASWWFMQQLLALEPGTENSGIWGDKPGYHGTRAENYARNGWDDYSVRALLDRLGPADKGAGYDWTFATAQRGDYSRMALRGGYLLAAFNARDPRLAGWREALGQTDRDSTAEGLDFQNWYKRTPDDSHEWHFHFSEVRAYVESYANKQAFLSVLSGETLSAYLARGGRLIGADMADTPGDVADHYRLLALMTLKPEFARAKQIVPEGQLATVPLIDLLHRVDTNTGKIDGLVRTVALLAEAVNSGGGSIETAAVLAHIDKRAAEDVDRDNQVAARIAQLEADLEAANERAAAAARGAAAAYPASPPA